MKSNRAQQGWSSRKHFCCSEWTTLVWLAAAEGHVDATGAHLAASTIATAFAAAADRAAPAIAAAATGFAAASTLENGIFAKRAGVLEGQACVGKLFPACAPAVASAPGDPLASHFKSMD